MTHDDVVTLLAQYEHPLVLIKEETGDVHECKLLPPLSDVTARAIHPIFEEVTYCSLKYVHFHPRFPIKEDKKMIIDETTIKDMYEVRGGVPLTNHSEIIQCKRKKDGKRQYTIRYQGAKTASGSVRHDDIPNLIAALLDIYSNDVKSEFDEIPF